MHSIHLYFTLHLSECYFKFFVFVVCSRGTYPCYDKQRGNTNKELQKRYIDKPAAKDK